MEIFYWETILQISQNIIEMPKIFASGTAISIGSFDGVHIGHQKLLKKILEQGKKNGYSCGTVSFVNPLGGRKTSSVYKGDVSTLAQRLEAFELAGLDFALVIDFSDDFGRMSGERFLSILKKCCNLKFLAEGQDFHCGHLGATGIEEIKSFSKDNDFCLEVVPPVMYNQQRVSSSRIRKCVLNRDFKAVEYMLERPYTVDCSRFNWSIEECEKRVFLSAKRDFFQVFPEENTYDVWVILSSGSKKNTCKTKLIVESQYLRLEILQFDDDFTIKAIEFISDKI